VEYERRPKESTFEETITPIEAQGMVSLEQWW
jgi:hypothetical protein